MGIYNIGLSLREEDSERDVWAQHGPTYWLLCWPQGWQSLPLGRHHHWPPRFLLTNTTFAFKHFIVLASGVCFFLVFLLTFHFQLESFCDFEWWVYDEVFVFLRPLLLTVLLLSLISLFCLLGFLSFEWWVYDKVFAFKNTTTTSTILVLLLSKISLFCLLGFASFECWLMFLLAF